MELATLSDTLEVEEPGEVKTNYFGTLKIASPKLLRSEAQAYLTSRMNVKLYQYLTP